MAIQDRNEQRNGPFGNLDVAIYLLFVTLHLALLDRLPDSLLDTFSLQIILNSGKNILLLVDVDKQFLSIFTLQHWTLLKVGHFCIFFEKFQSVESIEKKDFLLQVLLTPCQEPGSPPSICSCSDNQFLQTSEQKVPLCADETHSENLLALYHLTQSQSFFLFHKLKLRDSKQDAFKFPSRMLVEIL